MISKLKTIAKQIGNTPLKKMNMDNATLYVKLEYFNCSGSIKDRAAYSIVLEALQQGRIRENTTVVESSSGNFAIALATICRTIGVKFIAVIDPNVSSYYERLLEILCYKVVKVKELDRTGGYLLTRIEKVKEICQQVSNSFWPNQYENPYNYWGYYNTLGAEICRDFDSLDYIFLAVSSGGTITGVSKKVKEKFPDLKIIGVDIEGSVIFGQAPKRRFISGIGSSKVPPIIREASIDAVIHVSHENIIQGCNDLLKEHMIFGGASAGASMYAINQFVEARDHPKKPSILFMCPDKGNAYLDTVYSKEWIASISEKLEPTLQF
jgi:N-(2-amino-2-carboxyethyl)-L-glutamate synthase